MIKTNFFGWKERYKQVTENLNAIRNWLKSNVQELNKTKVSKRGREDEGRPEEAGSIRDIYNWLNKKGGFENTFFL